MMHFLNRLFNWIPLLHREGSDRGRVIFNLFLGGSMIVVVFIAVSYISGLIKTRVAHVHEKLLFQRTLEDNQDTFASLTKDYAQLEPIIPNIYAALPKEEDALLFADAIEKLSNDTGNQIVFQFDTQSLADDKAFPGVALVHFSATLNGSSDSFAQFLKSLASMRYFIMLDHMAIENSETSASQSKMSINGALFIQRNLSL